MKKDKTIFGLKRLLSLYFGDTFWKQLSLACFPTIFLYIVMTFLHVSNIELLINSSKVLCISLPMIMIVLILTLIINLNFTKDIEIPEGPSQSDYILLLKTLNANNIFLMIVVLFAFLVNLIILYIPIINGRWILIFLCFNIFNSFFIFFSLYFICIDLFNISQFYIFIYKKSKK
jgi:hypothetical protein